MSQVDLILLHPPSVYDFRKEPVMYGPISDVVPSTQIFEMYPIGFMSIREYLQRHGYSVRIINVALKMLRSRRFDFENLIGSLNPVAFGIDLHWLVHAQGALELARIVKKHRPETPVIFGGLSSSYFHEELILYPQVDYVIRGDSAEVPLRQLLACLKKGGSPEHGSLEQVSNLTWKIDGKVRSNALSHVPLDLDEISFDYRTMMSSSVRHLDLLGHLPFRGWINYPIVATPYCRGCTHNCIICGGSASAFNGICARDSTAYRSPELVARDIELVAHYFKGPIIILGDILQAGFEYGSKLLNRLKALRVKNHIAFELFAPPPERFLAMLSEAAPNFNIQISPESHDERIRKEFGKNYDNHSLERTIKYALDVGCKRVDVFFLIGLSLQTSESVRQTVEYCGSLMQRYGQGRNGKVHPYIAPLAPFLDPGSRAFERPEDFGYRRLYHTLEEHRRALLLPSWKYTLNYETEWMSRDELVASTYEAALELNRLKLQHGILNRREAGKVESRIRLEQRIIEEIDTAISIKDNTTQREEIIRIMRRYDFVNHSTVCNKDEMKWPLKFIRFSMLRLIQATIAEVKRKVSLS